MKKYFLFVMAVLAGLFTSCKEEMAPALVEGDTNVTIKVQAPQQNLGTRSGAAAFADPALSDMRVALIISTTDNQVVTVTTKTHSFGTGSTACTFDARLYKGKTYNISVWADYGSAYYTIPTQPETKDEAAATKPVIKMASLSIDSCSNKYDAYFGNVTTALSDNGDINVSLKRPFALVKVNTADWNENAVKLANYRPDHYATTFSAPTQLDLVSGVADSVKNIAVAAAIVDYAKDTVMKELHYNYLFANEASSILPKFTVDYKQGSTTNSDYEFENIPVQRNYKTNITGNILTKNGKINVTVDPMWNTPSTEVVLVDVQKTTEVVSALKQAQTANPTAQSLGVNVKSEAAAATGTERPIEIPATYTAGSGTSITPIVKQTIINLEGGVKDNETIIIRDEYNNENTANITTYPGVICISAKDASASNFDFQTPAATVYLNGTKIKDAVAQTADNTFVIDATSEITGILTIKKGNIDLYGKVNSIVRHADNQDAKTIINIYDGAMWTNWATEKASNNIQPIVNCGTYAFDPTGYNVEGSVVIANEGTPATWTVTIDNEWSSHAAKEFSNVSGTTITIMNAAELALFAKNVNAKVDYIGYTIKLGTYIDLSAHDWTPIMLSYEPEDANFTFDGCGYTIYGLKMNREENYSGLFGTFFSRESIIQNVIINNPQITQTQNSDPTKAKEEVGLNYTAALVAHMACGKVINCSIIGGTIAGAEQVGAIAGYVANGSVTQCSVNGTTISGNNRVGGLVGKANNWDGHFNINNNTLTNVTVSADKQKGGLVGQIMGDNNNYEIKNNAIDIPGVNCPIGTLRTGQEVAFTSAIEQNITGNTWTKATLDAESYTYTADETNGAGVQIIWNGEPKLWIAYAASAYASETNNAITISTPEQLALLAKRVNNGTSYNGYTITISSTLDMSAHWWVPINARSKFEGATIQGINNAAINNLLIDKAVYGGNYNYYAGFIAQSTGTLIIKDLNFEGAVSVSNGSGIAVVLGLSYGNTTFENVTVQNSQITATTKAGALLGFSGGDGIAIKMKNCSINNVTVTSSYSYALFAGLININDHIEFEGCSATNSNAVFDKSLGDFEGYKEIAAGGKTYTYGIEDNNLWITGVNNAWAEIRTNPNPTKTIDQVTYTIMGDKVFLDNGTTPITIVE